MPISARYPDGRSQHFTFPRRELLQKVVALTSLCLLPKSQPSPFPSPEFSIGDLVASDWEQDDDDDAPLSGTDFGQILGMRWVPEPDAFSLVTNSWVYYVRWTHSTSGDFDCYPCYEGEPTEAEDLRRVSHV
jgi:hypothetical protein